jgi:Kdo2-lipid IVA lauroyltransferase/acyltransferase
MIGRRSKKLLEAMAGSVAASVLRAGKLADRKRTANFAGAIMRKVGPLLNEHRIGRDNLRAAYPEKSDAEIEKILGGVWDNLGRVVAEFTHLDEIRVDGADGPAPDGMTYAPQSAEQFQQIINGETGTITFAAHLANWEVPAVGARLLGLKTAILYRPPNVPAVRDAITKLRAGVMGELIPTGLGAPVRLARLLQSGVHVGMLVDQYDMWGIDVMFFGRPCKTNPLIALLARQTECPIRGMRVARQPDGNSFWCEITEPIVPPRAADGRIDVQGTMQAITSVIEGWVRERPEQWLWVHRRWR